MESILSDVCLHITDTEADVTEIVNRLQKSTHQAVIQIEVQQNIYPIYQVIYGISSLK